MNDHLQKSKTILLETSKLRSVYNFLDGQDTIPFEVSIARVDTHNTRIKIASDTMEHAEKLARMLEEL